jgi:hydrogenase maturation protein HypF
VNLSGAGVRDPPRGRDPTDAVPLVRDRLEIRGAVQGVGFRPFVYRLADELGLAGWVRNAPHGVVIEVEGAAERVRAFRTRMRRERPPLSLIERVAVRRVPSSHATGFEIHVSTQGEPTALVLPDIATCPACLREIFDPANRRYRYPFTNCTHCGPRYSIIERLPYDRANTTMRMFPMCERCRAEFHDVRDRRFHAQPTACPACGPRLALWDAHGAVLASGDVALLAAAAAVRDGRIVAVKGLGGFQLLVDAGRDEAVRRLRLRKAREAKPFALMVTTPAMAGRYGRVQGVERRLLTSPQAPIVLLRRMAAARREIAPSVAPDNPYLGVMLPYTPLHHLLIAELARPVVATSGNLCDEPICTDEGEALERLRDVADLFLVHDRPIARHVDDSVVTVTVGRELILRRARGYAPFPLRLAAPVPALLATGAQLKNAVAVSVGDKVFLSQHIGDLQSAQGRAAFERTIGSLCTLYDLSPRTIACDAHPDYVSTQYARRASGTVVAVQHHEAHVLACMAEHRLAAPLLGVAWDGTGYGPDGTVWGGEFFRITGAGTERVGHLRAFRLPGAERAIEEPRRAALGLLYELLGPAVVHRRELAPVAAFSAGELQPLLQMLARGTNAPLTSSMGRLFDAVAALLDLCQASRFEGEAAMAVEFTALRANRQAPATVYALPIMEPLPGEPRRFTVDWAPAVRAMLEHVARGIAPSVIAAAFHAALAELLVRVARHVGERRVVLSGGCFQNRLLTERAVARLRGAGFTPYWHRRIPPNDGGIAVGQVVGAARLLQGRTAYVSRSTRTDRQPRAG